MSDEKKSLLEDIKLKKRSLTILKLKFSAGENVGVKNIRNTRKDIARLLTKLNKLAA